MKKIFGIKIIISITVICLSIKTVKSQAKNSLEINFSPCGGNIIYGYSGSPGIESRLSYGIGFEFQHDFGKRVTLGIGFEYYQHKYGSSSTLTDYDTSGNSYTTGYYDYSLDHHYIGIPLKMYINFVNKDKFRLYGFAGFTPRVVTDIVMDSKEYNVNHVLIEREYQSAFGGYSYPSYQPSRFALEFQCGVGGRYNFTPKFHISANALFGINCTTTIVTTGFSSFGMPLMNNFRYGGTIGIGYSF